MTYETKRLRSGEQIILADDGIYCLDDPSGQVCQPVPQDMSDYAYTHGGELYREACREWWAWWASRAEAREADAEEVR